MTHGTGSTMVAIDGLDALFFLIVRPGPGSTAAGGSSVLLEHGGSGLSMGQAAYILRKVADDLDAAEQPSTPALSAAPESTTAEAPKEFPPNGGHGEMCAYVAGISRRCSCRCATCGPVCTNRTHDRTYREQGY